MAVVAVSETMEESALRAAVSRFCCVLGKLVVLGPLTGLLTAVCEN
jgi:hypothetical protein